MKEFLPKTEALEYASTINKPAYTHFDNIIEEFPPITETVHTTIIREDVETLVKHEIEEPRPLVIESLHYLGREPKRVLDIGCFLGRHSLYLAVHGHEVTAMDLDDSLLERTREAARKLGVPSTNFRVVKTAIEDFDSSLKYDGIYANMVLHFLAKYNKQKAVSNIQSMTLENGINVVNNYTLDNPPLTVSKDFRQGAFELGETGRYYPEKSWFRHYYYEGDSDVMLPKDNEEEEFWYPGVSEIIAQKKPSFEQKKPTVEKLVSQATGYPEDYIRHLRRADPEHYDTLAALYA